MVYGSFEVLILSGLKDQKVKLESRGEDLGSSFMLFQVCIIEICIPSGAYTFYWF